MLPHLSYSVKNGRDSITQIEKRWKNSGVLVKKRENLPKTPEIFTLFEKYVII